MDHPGVIRIGGNSAGRASGPAVGAPPRPPQARLMELDVLRALAALGVIVIHVTASALAAGPEAGRSFWLLAGLNEGARFSIPAFVFISGVALFYSYADRPVRAGSFWRKRLGAVALPYLVWSLFYVLFTAWLGHVPMSKLPRLAGLAILQGSAMYQLYFVVLILQFYLLFPFFRPLGKSRWLALLAVGALALQFWLMAKAAPLWGWGPQPSWFQSVLRWQDRLFPWWLGYFAAGAWMGVRLAQVRAFLRRWRWPLLVTSGALLAALVWDFAARLAEPGANVAWAASGFRPLAYGYSLAAIAAMLAVAPWLLGEEGAVEGGTRLRTSLVRPVTLDLARLSFGIYLVHPLVVTAWTYLLMKVKLPIGPALLFVVTFLVVLAGSYVFTRLAERLPFSHWIIGKV